MLKNTLQGYGWISIVLHWSIALALFGLFGLGVWMVDLGLYDAWYHKAPALHISIGVITVSLMLVRLLWRWTNPVPKAFPQPALLEWVAAAMHQLFYVWVVALGVSGYMISTAEGDPLLIFEVLAIPALDLDIDNQADLAGEVHFWLAWSLIGFALLHALAAFKHHFINQDKTLTRMLIPTQKKELNNE
ncbi:cytochrome B [Hydrogenovibrio sp. SC-1]|uniref:cytochrome b n=1 Tax=Hydrogenovibrio sp. SC-1 TaxID=2065820 RepID=UPI000C7D7F2D|nr:cytochrome b [Hydrogenovibrio sp. SC-1]PLA74215.1 cytochrome B [Hydrogenovibrio sp. SC-1]